MPVFTCQSTVEMTNGHTHALTVPGSDIAQGYQEVPYTLEDGGTGHIHTLTLSGYDMAFLQAGVSRMVASSVDADHSHVCDISCSMG
jgi:hypothetical protein